MNWLDLMCQDRRGKNFVEIVVSIDVAREEWWSAILTWEDFNTPSCTIRAVTQYNPPFACRHECDHFPRNHLDDGTFDLEGTIVEDGRSVI